MTATATRKPRKARTPKTETFQTVLDSLYDKPGQTRQDLALNPVYVRELGPQGEGLIKVIGKIETGKRGRPQHKLGLTKKAKERVKRQRAAAAKNA